MTTVISVVIKTVGIERVVRQTGQYVSARWFITMRTRYTFRACRNLSGPHGVTINQVVGDTVRPHQRGYTLIVPVYEERWVLQLVLVEEVQVVKRRTELAQGEVVALRREELVVERLDSVTDQWMPEPSPCVSNFTVLSFK